MESAVVINWYNSEVRTVHISGTEIVSLASQSKLDVPATASDKECTPVDPDPVVTTAPTMSMAAMEGGDKAVAELVCRSDDDLGVMVVDGAGVGTKPGSESRIAAGTTTISGDGAIIALVGSGACTESTSSAGVYGLG